MSIEKLIADANQAIERNQQITVAGSRYRADHHSELVAACILLRDALEEAGERSFACSLLLNGEVS